MRYAKQRHKNMVLKYRGLAKLALGMAMHAVSANETPSVGNVTNKAREVGAKVVSARVMDSGFSSGQVSIHVEDNLDYAADAIKNGQSYIDTAVQKALNSAVGYLNRRFEKRGIEDALNAPFPEVKA